VPAAGWAQIIFLVGLHELTVAKQDYTKVPGEIPTFLSFKPEDPDVRCRTRTRELEASLPAKPAMGWNQTAQERRDGGPCDAVQGGQRLESQKGRRPYDR